MIRAEDCPVLERGGMFESITDKLNGVFRTLAGKAKISESNVADAVREVRVALLEADVSLEVARTFMNRVREEALGEKVLAAVDPGQQFVKIVHDQLVRLLGGDRAEMAWVDGAPTVVMLCGLQGAGKTTTAGKLARRWKEEGRRPLLVAADVQRPAAIEQLRVLGRQIDVPVHAQEGGDPLAICKQAMEIARWQEADTILLDTAGRLHVDDALMEELSRIARATDPAEILFICDAMIGQSAVDTAVEFGRRLLLTGAVMTKLDSDARGGAALSLREVSGVPIKYVTVGEKMEALEEFHPDRMAGRILGMGDVVTLVEKAQAVVDEKEAEALAAKLQKNDFNLEDFQKQLGQIKRMGSMKDLLSLIPGVGSRLKDIDVDEKQFKQIEALIQSMTVEERRHPEIIGASRMQRIAAGAGRSSSRPVKDLLKQFGQMRKMIGQMGKAGMFAGGAETMEGMETLAGAGANPHGAAAMHRMDRMFGGSKKSGTKAQRDKKKDRKKNKKKRR